MFWELFIVNMDLREFIFYGNSFSMDYVYILKFYKSKKDEKYIRNKYKSDKHLIY